MKKQLIAASLAMVIGSGALAAGDMQGGQNNSARHSTEFSQLDSDRDGRITRQEAQRHSLVSRDFAELDIDRDGFLTSTEFDQRSQEESEEAE